MTLAFDTKRAKVSTEMVRSRRRRSNAKTLSKVLHTAPTFGRGVAFGKQC